MGLRSKFIIFVSIMIIVVAAVVSTTSLERERVALTEELIHRTQSLAVNLAAAGRRDLENKDGVGLFSLIENLETDKDFFYVRFTDAESNTLAEQRELGVLKESLPAQNLLDLAAGVSVNKEFISSQMVRGDHTIYSAAVPAFFYESDIGIDDILMGTIEELESAATKTKVGAVNLYMSSKRIDEEIRSSRIVAVLLTIGIVLAAIMLVFYLSRFIVRPIQELARVAARIGKGELHHEITIRSRDEVGQLASTFKQMLESLKEKKLLEETFGRYVSPQVAQKIQKEMSNIELGGESREVTVLFADVRNFTTFSETHTPEEVVSTLNEYFSCMIDTIVESEGILDKFIGDCVMAVFGAPLPQEDHALRACRCSLEIQKRLGRLGFQRKKDGQAVLDVGIGINTGTVIVGNLGNEKRMEFSVIGDAVNLASRVNGVAKGGQVLIGVDTYEKGKDILEARSMGQQRVKGKRDPITIFELIAVHGS